MKKLTEQEKIILSQQLDCFIDNRLESVGIRLHNTTLERIADNVFDFLILEKIIKISYDNA